MVRRQRAVLSSVVSPAGFPGLVLINLLKAKQRPGDDADDVIVQHSHVDYTIQIADTNAQQ